MRRTHCASLDEGFLYELSIDRTTYEEQRDKLREELTLAELELSEAQVEQFDIDSALAKAISILNKASALWIDASLDDRLRLQEVLFPQGLVWDGARFQTPVTCLSFYHLTLVEGPGRQLLRSMDFKSNPINLLAFQRVARRIRGRSKRWYRYGDSNPGLMAENHPS